MSPIRIRFTLDNGKTSYSEIEDYSDYVGELTKNGTRPVICAGMWTLKEVRESSPQLFPAYGWLEAIRQSDFAPSPDLIYDDNVKLSAFCDSNCGGCAGCRCHLG